MTGSSTTHKIDTTKTISIKSDREMPGPFQKYKYGAFINSPEEMGMKGSVDSKWGLETIGTNFGGLISYVELLVTGTSEASKAAAIDNELGGARFQQPLGNAYTFTTGFQCIDPDGNKQDAVAYINNIPLGNIPFISNFMGAGDQQELRGLLPGIFEDFNGFNPMQIVDALDISNLSPCEPNLAKNPEYYLPQTNINDEGTDYKTGMPPVSYGPLFMFESMVKDIDPCLFRGNAQGEPDTKRNPVTGKSCKENFANINGETTPQSNNINTRLQTDIENNLAMLSKLNGEDWLVQIYFLSFILLIIFITIKVLNKTCRV